MTDTSIQNLDFLNNIVGSIPGILAKGMLDGVKLAWSWFLDILIKDWKFFMSVYFIVFFIATFEHMLGRWGLLGSVLYNSIYFGILFILGLTFGPQIFIDDIFNTACTVILYPAFYLIVGYILDKIKN